MKDVRDLLKTQFPPTTKDITDDEMFDVMDDVLRLQSTTPGKLPLTLVVLDEMQQYIGDDNEKALAVQNIVEGCSARFESQVLFVATGQSALTATPTLQKLTDRFTVQVALSDKDVETVVREVVLRKKPEHVPDSEGDARRGQRRDRPAPRRHAARAPKAADKPDLVPDYPLLPTRRRFWELALRAIDRAGKAGRAAHAAPDRPRGRRARSPTSRSATSSAPTSLLRRAVAVGMLQSGVLLKEIDELIRGLRARAATAS